MVAAGSDCSVDLCAGITCNGHGTCKAGSCECTGGYSGAECNTGGGECASNADCGVFAPIEGSETPDSQCSGDYTCVDNKYGGTCTAGQCNCNSGFTCDTCNAKGEGSSQRALWRIGRRLDCVGRRSRVMHAHRHRGV